jgi:hypothetical protein
MSNSTSQAPISGAAPEGAPKLATATTAAKHTASVSVTPKTTPAAKAPGAPLASKSIPVKPAVTTAKLVPSKGPTTPAAPTGKVDKTIKAIDDGTKIVARLGGLMGALANLLGDDDQ